MKPPSLTADLFRLLATPAGDLSPLELRLLKLTSAFLFDSMTFARVKHFSGQPDDKPLPFSPDLYAEAVGLAFRAACEVEKPLRELRDEVMRRQRLPEKVDA